MNILIQSKIRHLLLGLLLTILAMLSVGVPYAWGAPIDANKTKNVEPSILDETALSQALQATERFQSENWYKHWLDTLDRLPLIPSSTMDSYKRSALSPSATSRNTESPGYSLFEDQMCQLGSMYLFATKANAFLNFEKLQTSISEIQNQNLQCEMKSIDKKEILSRDSPTQSSESHHSFDY